jgi:hypothetical protein
VLQIDDAFAGGVCRCQHCGTIQTVPASLKRDGRGGSATPAAKALYQRKTRASRSQSTSAPPATAAPAAVESSRERKPRAAAPVHATPKRDLRQLRPVLIIAGAAVVVIIAIILWAR